VQDQLGLRLEQKNGQIDFVVIDKMEKAPTEKFTTTAPGRSRLSMKLFVFKWLLRRDREEAVVVTKIG